MARILITGINGYAGACIADVLVRSGHEVAGLSGRLEEITPASLAFDFVVHAAGARPHKPPAEFETSNRIGTERLVSGLTRPAAIIFLSSRAVYSPTKKEFLDESDATAPKDDYGLSKLQAERAVIGSGHDWMALRLPAIYGWGKGQPGFSHISHATQTLLRGGTVTVHEPDRNHDYLHVWTLAEMVARMIGAGRGWNQVYNLAGPPVSHHAMMETLAGAVARRTGRPANLHYQPGPPSRATWLDYGKFTAAFGPTGQPVWQAIVAELAAKSPE